MNLRFLFTEYGQGNRYGIEEVISKDSYDVMCSVYDTHLRKKVAIKKINVFEYVININRFIIFFHALL